MLNKSSFTGTAVLPLALIGAFFLSSGLMAEDPKWPTAESGVAWKTKKKMFLVKTVEPVGVNTSIKMTKKVFGEGQFKIRFDIPIDKFNSGEPKRDEEVVKILKGDKQANLIFTTEVLDYDRFEKIMTQSVSKVTGDLQIGGKSNSITLNLKKNGAFLDGRLKTTFTAFGIEPPTVAGGAVAKVQDMLILMAHLKLDQLKVLVGPNPELVKEPKALLDEQKEKGSKK